MGKLTLILRLGIVALLYSCSVDKVLTERVDPAFFTLIGTTLFSNPEYISVKEIHLDQENMAEKNVIVDGNLVEMGKHDTYLIMADDTARLLVNLSNIHPICTDIKKGPKVNLRVWGVVERGKRGMPFLSARAVSVVKENI